MLVPARVTKLKTFGSGELRLIEIKLPASVRTADKEHCIQDGMRPGAAFSVDRLHQESLENQNRHYTRSNCSINAHGRLQTMVNVRDQSDAACWWSREGIQEGDSIGVRVDSDRQGRFLRIHEATSLALEPDSWWTQQNFVGVAFSTCVTPSLAHITRGFQDNRLSPQSMKADVWS